MSDTGHHDDDDLDELTVEDYRNVLVMVANAPELAKLDAGIAVVAKFSTEKLDRAAILAMPWPLYLQTMERIVAPRLVKLLGRLAAVTKVVH